MRDHIIALVKLKINIKRSETGSNNTDCNNQSCTSKKKVRDN